MDNIKLVKIINTKVSYENLLILADLLSCTVVEFNGKVICRCDIEANVSELKATIRDMFNVSDGQVLVTFSDIGKKQINQVSKPSLYIKTNKQANEIKRLKELQLALLVEINNIKGMTVWEFFINKFKK